MEKVRIVAVRPWGTSTQFVPPSEVEAAVAEFKAQGAEKVYVGAEAAEYQATEGEMAWIQEMADHDWRGPDA